MKTTKITLILFFLSMPYQYLQAQVKSIGKLLSPDKKTILELGIDAKGSLCYKGGFNGSRVLQWSKMGLKTDKGTFGEHTSLISARKENHREDVKWSLGENDFLHNNYNALELKLLSDNITFTLFSRAYNGSIAIQYQIPEQKNMARISIKKELTSFVLSRKYEIYQNHHESVFMPTAIDSLKTTSDLPSTLKGKGSYLSIAEADNTAYTKAELKRGEIQGSLEISFERDSAVTALLPFRSPWRTLSFSKDAVGLHQFSDLSLRLSTPAAQISYDWVVPGKLIRSELNTQAGIDCIDFAKKMDFQYIMFDAGWYGPERSLSSNPSVPIAAIDMQKLSSYAKEKNIGIILYVNLVGLRNHIDEILPLYKSWGIKGLKFGFVDGFSQAGINWISGAIKKVNDAGLFLDIHDNYKPTGLSRTFPALLTQEGIRGDENSPDAFHTTTLPFTRFLAGPADFTFCFPNPKNSFSKNLKVSKAHQLALSVVYFSPLQSIFWYGKPKDYTNWDEIEFFKYLPTVWKKSIYLKGEIGQNISVARQKDGLWFIGNAAGPEQWKDSIGLDFLDKGKEYTATIYEDGRNLSILKRSFKVKKGDKVDFDIAAKGGQAIIIRP